MIFGGKYIKNPRNDFEGGVVRLLSARKLLHPLLEGTGGGKGRAVEDVG